MTSSKVLQIFKRNIKKALKPLSNLSMADWCEKNIYLSTITAGTNSGPYSLKNYHYLRGIYDSVQNPLVRKVVVIKSTQSGLTTLTQNIILWYVCNRNVPITFFTSTLDLAKKFSKRSLVPTINECKALQEYRTNVVDKETITYIEFNNCIVKLGYAGSVNSLASDPACLVILDEVSKWTDSKTEAKSYELALARSITYPLDKKQILCSTPAEESTCVINKEYLTGDQRIFHIPSPHTGKLFELTIDLLKKPADYQDEEGNYDWVKVRRGAWLEDPTTRVVNDAGKVITEGKPIYEHQKASLVRRGEWIASNPNPKDPDCHSYKVTSLYSMDTSWGELLVRFIQAMDDMDKLKELRTQYLGQTWKQIAASVRLEEIEKIVESSPRYPLGVVPEYLGEDGVLLGACDQQLDCFYFVILALCASGKAYVIDYGKVLSLDDLEKLQHKVFTSMDGKEEYYCQKFLVDEGGFATTPIRDFSVTTGFNFVACKGVKASYGQPYKNSEMQHGRESIPYVLINDTDMKNQLLLTAIKGGKGDLYLPYNLEEEFKRQICNEELIKNSRDEWEWKRKGMQHYLDCLKYAWALVDYNRRRLAINTVSVEVSKETN